jgi:hypothetical protein
VVIGTVYNKGDTYTVHIETSQKKCTAEYFFSAQDGGRGEDGEEERLRMTF